ncbi:MAG: ribosome maturation factor RimM [Halieaceae bacterium]|nr:ribosome maturation factor RimM [Halieaceae bacterium]
MSGPVANAGLTIGRITGCFGVKGWIKIHSYTEPAENLLNFNALQIQRKDGLEPIELSAGQRHGKGLVAQIRGVDDRNQAQLYSGLDIVIAADALPELNQGDFYWAQLQGLQVWYCSAEQRILLGIVDHLIETGANDVLVVAATEGSIDQRERLIPYLPGNVVSRVDLGAAVIEVDWPPDF